MSQPRIDKEWHEFIGNQQGWRWGFAVVMRFATATICDHIGQLTHHVARIANSLEHETEDN